MSFFIIKQNLQNWNWTSQTKSKDHIPSQEGSNFSAPKQFASTFKIQIFIANFLRAAIEFYTEQLNSQASLTKLLSFFSNNDPITNLIKWVYSNFKEDGSAASKN